MCPAAGPFARRCNVVNDDCHSAGSIWATEKAPAPSLSTRNRGAFGEQVSCQPEAARVGSAFADPSGRGSETNPPWADVISCHHWFLPALALRSTCLPIVDYLPPLGRSVLTCSKSALSMARYIAGAIYKRCTVSFMNRVLTEMAGSVDGGFGILSTGIIFRGSLPQIVANLSTAWTNTTIQSKGREDIGWDSPNAPYSMYY